MEIAEVVNFIGTIGFPIAGCVFMAYYIKYITDKHREEVKELNEQHRVEMGEVTQAINNNTLALTKLCDKLGEGDINEKLHV